MTTPEQTKAIVRRLYEEVLNPGGLDALDALTAADMVDHSAATAGWAPGRAGFKHHLAWARSVLPDLQIAIEEMVTEGEAVVVFWMAVGTQAQPLFGMPVTGRQVSVSVVSTVRVRGGQVVEYRPRPDRLDFLQQVGAIISPPPPVPATGHAAE